MSLVVEQDTYNYFTRVGSMLVEEMDFPTFRRKCDEIFSPKDIIIGGEVSAKAVFLADDGKKRTAEQWTRRIGRIAERRRREIPD